MVTRKAELIRALAEDLALEILTSYTEDDFEEPRPAHDGLSVVSTTYSACGRSAAAKTRVSGSNPLHRELAVVGYVPLCEVSL